MRFAHFMLEMRGGHGSGRDKVGTLYACDEGGVLGLVRIRLAYRYVYYKVYLGSSSALRVNT